MRFELLRRQNLLLSILAHPLCAVLASHACDDGLASELERFVLALTAHEFEGSLRDEFVGLIFTHIDDDAAEAGSASGRRRLLRVLRLLLDQQQSWEPCAPWMIQHSPERILQAALQSLLTKSKCGGDEPLEAMLLLRLIAERCSASTSQCLGAAADAIAAGAVAAVAAARSGDRPALVTGALHLLTALSARSLFTLSNATAFSSSAASAVRPLLLPPGQNRYVLRHARHILFSRCCCAHIMKTHILLTLLPIPSRPPFGRSACSDYTYGGGDRR